MMFGACINIMVTVQYDITLSRSITLLCGTDNIIQNILHIPPKWWNILQNFDIWYNIVMDLNDVMEIPLLLLNYICYFCYVI